MTIRLDCTQISVVVLCTLCPWWRGFGFDKHQGWAVGARHESTMHPGSTQAATALRVSNFRAK